MAPLRRSMTAIAVTMLIAANFTGIKAGAEDVAPGGATVLTLDPAFNSLPANWLRGELFASPNVKIKVPYPNYPAASNVHRGSDALDRYLHAYGGPKFVLGHSEGAQVEDDWLRRYGPTSDIDPATVTFVLTGDLESKYNGCANVPNSGCRAAYGGKGFPADTRYTVKVIARQYDFWADCPNDLSNATALWNRIASIFVGGRGQLEGPHGDYSNLSLIDPGNKTYVEGNATYILGAPATYYLPMITLKLLTPDDQKRVQDMQTRPAVEAAYHRPMEAPAPPY